MVDAAIAGVRVGLARPLVLAALPAAALVLAYLTLAGDGVVGRRRRAVLLGTRLLVALLLVGAAAGPYTVTVAETPGDPSVTMLVDRSASTEVAPDVAEGLAADIEARGVPVTTRVVADGNGSRLGDAVVGSLRTNGSLLLVSDGQVTAGRSLTGAAALARRANATLSAVALGATEADAGVRLLGPATTSTGVRNDFLVRVAGVNLAGEREVTVRVDGAVVETATVRGAGSVAFAHAFNETGAHRVTVDLSGTDAFDANDRFRKTVRVVEPPRVLYVARGDYPLGDLLNETYDVERARRVPGDLDPYLAVVVQDMPADELGNVSALGRYVIDGNGLVVAGGDRAYGNGDYESSPLSAMLPVRNGSTGQRSRIALAIDISGSATAGLDTQKALALDVVNQLGDDNVVGAVAFDYRPYVVAEPEPLSTSRERLRTRIRRLQSGGFTQLGAGLRGGGQLLGRGGTVILLTDGRNTRGDPVQAASELRAFDTKVIAVGVGERVNERLLKDVARAGGGTYFRANQTDRLRVLFGGESRPFRGRQLTVVDPDHFITAGVEFTADPARTHEVVARDGADLLVAGAGGNPALSSWRYGLGRVVSVTAYGSDGTLDGWLTRPDSRALVKSVNWAVGDPRRKREGVVAAPDARVGVPTTIEVRSDERPTSGDRRFVRTAEGTYRATVVPDSAGYASVLDATYAVNAHPEYAGVGVSPALEAAVTATGGRVYEAASVADRDGEPAAEIARAVTSRARTVQEVRREWGWALLVAALLVYLGEVVARRLETVTGRALLGGDRTA